MFNQSLYLIQKNSKELFLLQKKDLKFIFKKLQDGIPEDIAARFVGGCVRNYLLNEKIDDIDIATILTTDQIKQKLKNTNLKIIDTGEHIP